MLTHSVTTVKCICYTSIYNLIGYLIILLRKIVIKYVRFPEPQERLSSAYHHIVPLVGVIKLFYCPETASLPKRG